MERTSTSSYTLHQDNSLQGQGLNAMTEGQDVEVEVDMNVFFSS